MADYVMPGPNRPLQLVGTVHDGQGHPLTAAEISITEVGAKAEPIVMKTNDSGQFGFKFPPGSFHMSFKHPASKLALEKDIKVEQNPTPVPAFGDDTLHKIEQTYVLQ